MSFQWPVDLAGARYAVIASLTMCLIGPNGPIAAADAATFSADPSTPAAPQPLSAAAVLPPPDPNLVASPPPAILSAPDGSVLQLSGTGETQVPISPLTTSLASRSYRVGGTFNAVITSPATEEFPPRGTLEVGYQIGCGIDIASAGGITLQGTIGATPSLTNGPNGLLPGIGSPLSGSISVGLKPGVIRTIPVTKKDYTSDKPWVLLGDVRVDVDGCVGQSFLRSYATLVKSTDAADIIVSYFGATKTV